MKKRFSISICFTIICFSIQSTKAQELKSILDQEEITTPNRPITIGLREGVNFSSVYDCETKETSKTKIGYNIGIIVDIPFEEKWSIQTGLSLITKGFKDQVTTYPEAETSKIICNATYLQIPLLFTYHQYLTKNTNWQINMGPYFAFGVAGKTTEGGKTTISGKEYSVKIEYDTFGKRNSNSNYGLNSFDAGLSCGIGVVYHKFYFGFQSDLGITNILNHDGIYGWNDDFSAQNRMFSTYIGFNL